MVQRWPRSSFAGLSAKVPSRIFGPWRSAKIATPRPAASAASPHQPVGLRVVVVGAVAHVEPGDVHAGVHELADPALAAGGRPRVHTIFALRTRRA